VDPYVASQTWPANVKCAPGRVSAVSALPAPPAHTSIEPAARSTTLSLGRFLGCVTPPDEAPPAFVRRVGPRRGRAKHWRELIHTIDNVRLQVV
jgi:hypothetical protein